MQPHQLPTSRSIKPHLIALLAIWLTLLAFGAAAQTPKRVALLIGNAAYTHERVLKNPVNDAVLLGRVFKDELRFSDVQVESNLSAQTMDRVVDAFVRRAQGADSVVFYYSGHGMKSPDRRNFLLPVDARTGRDDSPTLERQAVSAESIRDKLKPLGARVTLVILDACRDGPGAGRSGNKGLARMGGASNLLVAYATEEDRVAADGTSTNSPYAQALATALRKTNLPLLAQFDLVADEVRKVVPQQEPTREGNLRADAYLIGPAASPTAATTQQRAVITDSDKPFASGDFKWPADGAILRRFNNETYPGISIGGDGGSPVKASAQGRVVYSGAGQRGYGNLIILKHDDTYLSAYAHNSRLLVIQDQVVKPGDVIAEMGNTDTSFTHLHFEIRKNGKPVDPEPFLPRR